MKRSSTGRPGRPGLACILALAVLGVLSIIMGIVMAQGVSGRHMAERRGKQLQTLWLAQSGLEMAAARLVAEPSYAGETMRPIPGSLVTIKIQRRGGEYIVASEARYGLESGTPLVRRLERRWRLVGSSNRRRLQVAGSEL